MTSYSCQACTSHRLHSNAPRRKHCAPSGKSRTAMLQTCHRLTNPAARTLNSGGINLSLLVVIFATVGLLLPSGSDACDPVPPCDSCQALTTVPDPKNCTRYFTCALGRVYAPHMCNSGIYSKTLKTCVAGNPVTCTDYSGNPNPSPTRAAAVPWQSTQWQSSGGTWYWNWNRFTNPSYESPQMSIVNEVNSDLCGIKTSRNIVGGTGANPGEWPWQVSLQTYTGWRDQYFPFCGGTVINSRWIVTAAHCLVQRSPSSLYVVIGAYSLTAKDPGEVRIRAKSIVLHPQYVNYGNFPNDIALVELSQAVSLGGTNAGRPACLPNHGEMIPEEQPTSIFDVSTKGCWITGWGTTLGTASEDTLNEIKLSAIDQSTCQRRWPGYITPSHMCFGMGNSGACRGDSGGPVVCSRLGRFYLVGVVSWGEDTCVLNGYPDVVTRVSSFRNWIRSVVGS